MEAHFSNLSRGAGFAIAIDRLYRHVTIFVISSRHCSNSLLSSKSGSELEFESSDLGLLEHDACTASEYVLASASVSGASAANAADIADGR